MTIGGGSQGTVTYGYGPMNGDGTVNMSNFGLVTYTGLEPITNSGTSTDVIFNLPTGATNHAVLGDDGGLGNGFSRLSSSPSTFELTNFTNPSGSVTINRGNASDDLTVNALPDLSSTMIFGSSAAPLMGINVNGSVSSLGSVNLRAVDINSAVAGSISTSTGLSLYNTGTASTLAGPIAGTPAATLTKMGTGTLILSNSNTYAGSTFINQGVLQIQNDAALGTPPSVPTPLHLVINGSTLRTTSTFTLNGNRGTALGSGSGTGSGTIDVVGSVLTFDPVIADNGSSTSSLIKVGTGNLVLSNANTYKGATLLTTARCLYRATAASARLPAFRRRDILCSTTDVCMQARRLLSMPTAALPSAH